MTNFSFFTKKIEKQNFGIFFVKILGILKIFGKKIIDQFKSEIKAQIRKIIHVAYRVALILRDPPNKPIVLRSNKNCTLGGWHLRPDGCQRHLPTSLKTQATAKSNHLLSTSRQPDPDIIWRDPLQGTMYSTTTRLLWRILLLVSIRRRMERMGRRDVVSKTATNSRVRVKEATASSPDILTWKYTH